MGAYLLTCNPFQSTNTSKLMADFLAQSSDETQILGNRERRRTASPKKFDLRQTVVQLGQRRQRSNKGAVASLYRENFSDDAPDTSSKNNQSSFRCFHLAPISC